MLTEIVERLESKIGELLQLHRQQQSEIRRLRNERELLLQERERVRGDLDRIIARLDQLDGEES